MELLRDVGAQMESRRLKIEPWRVGMEPWRVGRPVVAN